MEHIVSVIIVGLRCGYPILLEFLLVTFKGFGNKEARKATTDNVQFLQLFGSFG